MYRTFYGCSSLNVKPLINKWNLENVKDKREMTIGCKDTN